MNRATASVTLRQYRFEVGFIAVAAAAAAVMGASIALRLNALAVSQGCLDAVNASQDGLSAGVDCFDGVRAGSEILGSTFLKADGTLQLSIMGLLPFLLGLFGGMPIVARELEDHTAQVAWSLNSSRARWLARQMLSVGLVVAVASVAIALIAIPVADGWVRWYQGEASQLIGASGPLAVVRTFAAFGVGAAVGALLGKTFPTFVVSATLLLVLLLAADGVRTVWLAERPQEVLATYSVETGQWKPMAGSHPQSFGFVAPDQTLITPGEARARATAAGVPPPGPDDPYDTAAARWYSENGYVDVPIGVSDATALGWAPFDGIIFGTVGGVSLVGAFVLVNRRRPF